MPDINKQGTIIEQRKQGSNRDHSYNLNVMIIANIRNGTIVIQCKLDYEKNCILRTQLEIKEEGYNSSNLCKYPNVSNVDS